MTVRLAICLAIWLLQLRKAQLERLVVGIPDYERRHSLELDKIVKALEVLG